MKTFAVALVLAASGVGVPGPGPAPGGPGTTEGFLPADKSGFATATAPASPVWLTVQNEGGLGEV